jgi:hypothetical protein
VLNQCWGNVKNIFISLKGMQLKMQQEILIIRGRILGKYNLSQCHELSFQKTNYVYLKNYLGSET